MPAYSQTRWTDTGKLEGLDPATGQWRPLLNNPDYGQEGTYDLSNRGLIDPYTFDTKGIASFQPQQGSGDKTLLDRYALPIAASFWGPAAGAAFGGAEAAGAATAGGGEVGSGYAASAPGWGTSGAVGADTVAGGVGTDAMTGGSNAMDLGGGLTVDEFGNTTGGLFEGGPGTVGAGDFAGTGAAASGFGGLSQADWIKLLGRAAPGLLGAYGANKQTSALQALAQQYADYGGPSRARYEASMTPGFDPNSIPGYAGAVDTASKSLLARLSAAGGNPYGNPSGLVEANKQIIAGTALPAIQAYQNQNGNIGFGGTLNSAGSFGGQAIGSNANMYNAIGAGAADVLNPPMSLTDLLKGLKQSGLT